MGLRNTNTVIYLIGSLRSPRVPEVAAILRAAGHDVFDSWKAAHPEADDNWRDYEKAKGLTYVEALKDYAALHVFNFDKSHLTRAECVVLVLPAGKSGHLELGWALGQGKKGYILLEGEPERWDVMYAFADGVFTDVKELVTELARDYEREWIKNARHYLESVFSPNDFHAGEQ